MLIRQTHAGGDSSSIIDEMEDRVLEKDGTKNHLVVLYEASS